MSSIKNEPSSLDMYEGRDSLNLFRHMKMAGELFGAEEITMYFNNRRRRNGVIGR